MTSLDDRTTHEALAAAREAMPADASARVRARVMAEARGARPAAHRRPQFLAVVAGPRRVAAAAMALAVFGGGGVAYAANTALPGDALYPLKRSAENAVVAVLPAGELENRLLVGLAERRAEEVRALFGRPDASEDDVLAAITELRNSLRNAASATALTEEELLRIRASIGDVPEWARQAVDDAMAPEGTSGSDDGTGSGSGSSGSGSGSGADSGSRTTGNPDASGAPDTSGNPDAESGSGENGNSSDTSGTGGTGATNGASGTDGTNNSGSGSDGGTQGLQGDALATPDAPGER